MVGGDSNACLQKFCLCGKSLERGHVHMITAVDILKDGMVTDKTSFFHLFRGKKYWHLKASTLIGRMLATYTICWYLVIRPNQCHLT